MKQIDIPSVFVSEQTANSLKEDYIYDKGWVHLALYLVSMVSYFNTADVTEDIPADI